MERHIRILAWLWVGYSSAAAIAATVGILILVLVVSDGEKTAGELLFLAVGSLPGIVAGLGLLKHRSWARILLLILGAIHLPFPPMTVLGVYTIWVLFKPGTRELLRFRSRL